LQWSLATCRPLQLKLQVSFAKEPYTRDNILQKRPVNQIIAGDLSTIANQIIASDTIHNILHCTGDLL